MPAPSQPPKRRRFLILRIIFFVASLPFVLWGITSYGQSAMSYAQTYQSRTGFWFWLWTLVFLFATWSIWRYLKKKARRARQLSAEMDARR